MGASSNAVSLFSTTSDLVEDIRAIEAESIEVIENSVTLDGWLTDQENFYTSSVPNCNEDGTFFGTEFVEGRTRMWLGHQCDTKKLIITLLLEKRSIQDVQSDGNLSSNYDE